MQTLFKACKQLMIKSPFYGLFLMRLNKTFDDKIPTACVSIDGINPMLRINKEFWNSLDDVEKEGILIHECGHILYGHLTENWDYLRKHDAKIANEAMDLEVNSSIPILQKDPYFYPAKFSLENNKGTLFYYDYLCKNYLEGGGIGGGNQLVDDHSQWQSDKMSDAQKQLIQQQIDSIAKSTAEQVQKSQGVVPNQFKDYIDKLFQKKERIFNWKQYFRKSIGTAIDVELRKTRKKESRRFPDASGLKHKRKASVLVAVDTSGSVSGEELNEFFSEINHIYKAGTDITIIECDAKIQRIYKYTGKWDGTVHGRGGTVFDEVYTYRNEHRRDFTACVFFTDGYLDVNTKLFGNNIWIITSNGYKQKYPGHSIFIPKKNK
jgi:predicted metal-dependent peptidase